MSEQEQRKPQQRRPKKVGLGSAAKKEKGPFDLPKDQKIIILGFNGKEFEAQNMAKGGRVNLRGGGICKKGMNKKARGANS